MLGANVRVRAVVRERVLAVHVAVLDVRVHEAGRVGSPGALPLGVSLTDPQTLFVDDLVQPGYPGFQKFTRLRGSLTLHPLETDARKRAHGEQFLVQLETVHQLLLERLCERLQPEMLRRFGSVVVGVAGSVRVDARRTVIHRLHFRVDQSVHLAQHAVDIVHPLVRTIEARLQEHGLHDDRVRTRVRGGSRRFFRLVEFFRHHLLSRLVQSLAMGEAHARVSHERVRGVPVHELIELLRRPRQGALLGEDLVTLEALRAKRLFLRVRAARSAERRPARSRRRFLAAARLAPRHRGGRHAPRASRSLRAAR